jgi:site-specific DNA-methyltransferase (adenine-specific)
MSTLEAGSVDLVATDPPYDIGYEYDEYDDAPNEDAYLRWCANWFAQVHRVLKPDGTFWLIIGDERVAQLRMIATQHPFLAEEFRTLFPAFHLQSWCVWYFTFGVACTNKFSRSHTHMLQFTKHKKKFTFNKDEPLVRVPSSRQLIYNDARANPAGKLPDNTWVLAPLDLAKAFTPTEDTWLESRVCGTFKERQERGTYQENKAIPQMPLKVMERIILASSKPGDVVLDPFCGTGTTGEAAVMHSRSFLGYELSKNYHGITNARLQKAIRSKSCPSTESPKKPKSAPRKKAS